MPETPLNRIAFVGNYLPRQCGIATFTTDLCESVAAGRKNISCVAVAVNDTHGGYAYPPEVRFEIEEQNQASYKQAADFLNTSGIKLVSLQHEYGIFGGPAGSHILDLLSQLKIPAVTTLHTVLRNPDFNQRKVLREIVQLSNRLVVMSKGSIEVLKNLYKVQEEKIKYIPHGIPDVPWRDPNDYKDLFGVEGRSVLLTFGLLSTNKGIEYVIEALPKVLQQHPKLTYFILGATHPHVKRQDGESYRAMLEQLIKKHGLSEHVVFHNRFVSLEELNHFIGAADIYITPYLNSEQYVSGTLAYTIGAGKAVISTPYWYAEELLADGRGMLVPFADSESIAQSILSLLNDDSKRNAIRKRAYEYGREMIWSNVVERYWETFKPALEHHQAHPRPIPELKSAEIKKDELPALKLDHLYRMTDTTGLFQHAVFTVPNYREGYTTDDNARALILISCLELYGKEERELYELGSRYLAFLLYAYNPDTRRFRNFLSYERQWLENDGSDDCQGRTIWALGAAIAHTKHKKLRRVANQLFQQSLPMLASLSSPRACAFAILGLHEYLKQYSGHQTAHKTKEILAKKLIDLYQAVHNPEWLWFEDSLSYCNAVLPHALLLCAQTMRRPELKEIAISSLEWLDSIQRAEDGHFVPIGSEGFYHRGKSRAQFDQQPVEAQSMISACLEVYRFTKNEKWNVTAKRIFNWFLGDNDLGLPLYDPISGGCRDGLHPDRINENQGAESTLAFLHSLIELRHVEENEKQEEQNEKPKQEQYLLR